jgi:hypothetical protein
VEECECFDPVVQHVDRRGPVPPLWMASRKRSSSPRRGCDG